MKITLRIIFNTIQNWIRRNVIAEGWEDESGFHYGKKPVDSEKTSDK
jgi:hypothetical protein